MTFAVNPAPFTFTGSGLTKAYPDQIMGAGSLLLTDFNHSLGGVSGVPVASGLIPNVAWQTANAIVAGTPGQAALSALIESNQTVGSSVSFPLIERSGKLGLHAIKSQANDVTGATYILRAAAAVEAYLTLHHADEAFYFSIWDYQTRAATTVGSPSPGLSGVLMGNTSTYINFFGGSTNFGPGNTGTGVGYGAGIVGRANLLTGSGAGFFYQGLKGYTGTYVSPGGNGKALLYGFGNTVASFNSFHVGGSQILYRAYVESLTKSAAAGGYANNGAITEGQRFTEVVARDTAMYNAAINTTGTFTATDAAGTVWSFAATGKLNGDTYTAPSGYA